MGNLRCFVGLVLSFLFVAGAGAADFVHLDTIMASDAAALDEFGGRFWDASVSTDGSTLLVAARADCPAGPDCGAAYVFVRTAGGWVQQAKLTGPDTVPGDEFLEVALSGDGNLALVGADRADCGAGLDCGAAYFFVRSGAVWTFQQKLTASDASAGDFFGSGVGLSADGNVALIGAPNDACGSISSCGAVYAFTRSGGVWTERQKLRGDADLNNSFGGGLILSADGSTALIVGDVHGGFVAAHAYVFTRSGDVWSFQQKLASLGAPLAFAFNMDISGDGTVAVIHENNFGPDSVYVFTRTGTAWSLETRLFGDIADRIGSSLAISADGQTLLAKSTRTCATGDTCQAAYLFQRVNGAWTLIQRVMAPPIDDFFGEGTVDISGDGRTLLIADPLEPCASGPSCGVVYLFGAPLPLEDVPIASHLGLALLALLLAASGAWMLARPRSV